MLTLVVDFSLIADFERPIFRIVCLAYNAHLVYLAMVYNPVSFLHVIDSSLQIKVF